MKYPTRNIAINEEIIFLFPDISNIILKFHSLIISHFIDILQIKIPKQCKVILNANMEQAYLKVLVHIIIFK